MSEYPTHYAFFRFSKQSNLRLQLRMGNLKKPKFFGVHQQSLRECNSFLAWLLKPNRLIHFLPLNPIKKDPLRFQPNAVLANVPVH